MAYHRYTSNASLLPKLHLQIIFSVRITLPWLLKPKLQNLKFQLECLIIYKHICAHHCTGVLHFFKVSWWWWGCFSCLTYSVIFPVTEWSEHWQTDPAALPAQSQACSKAGGNPLQSPISRLHDQSSCSCQAADGQEGEHWALRCRGAAMFFILFFIKLFIFGLNKWKS